MQKLTQHGYLVLADISGYTSFLAASELDHAHDILRDLLETVVCQLTPLLTLVKLEGDAVFAHAPEARLERGETLLELIESTYVAFRDRLAAMRRRTTCQCNACRAIPSLDLKFLVHHGDYIVQHVSRIQELVGSDVNLVHRLLKNGVSEETGWRAYVLFTEASVAHVGCQALELHERTESYEHLGDVRTFSLDLKARYRELTEARRLVVSPETADAILTHDFPAPPPIVWDWLNDPRKRTLAVPENNWKVVARPGGRTGVGAVNHCEHGSGVMVEQVLDWRPFEYFTVEYRQPPLHMTQTTRLEPISGGTRIHAAAQMHSPLPKWFRRFFYTRFVAKGFLMTWDHMERLLTEERMASEQYP